MVAGVVRRMKEAREGAELSRQEIAVGLGVDFTTVGRWERGASKDGPPLWAVWGYSRLLGIPIGKLLGDDPDLKAFQAANLDGLRKGVAELRRGLDDLERQISRGDNGRAEGL